MLNNIKMKFINFPLLGNIFKSKKIEKKYQLICDSGFKALAIESEKATCLDWDLVYRAKEYLARYRKVNPNNILFATMDGFLIKGDCKYNRTVANCFSYLEDYVDDIGIEKYYLENAYKNIMELTVETRETDNFERLGVYFPKDNKICVYDRVTLSRWEVKHVLMHELLHMASTNSNKDCGFCLGNAKLDNNQNAGIIGYGLNEGYTELLASRVLFGKEFSSYTLSYTSNVFIVRLIELMFDNNSDMTAAYFSNDTDAVYKACADFGMSDNEFKNILVNLDKLVLLNTGDVQEFLYVYKSISLIYDVIKRNGNEHKMSEFEQLVKEYFSFTSFGPEMMGNVVLKKVRK